MTARYGKGVLDAAASCLTQDKIKCARKFVLQNRRRCGVGVCLAAAPEKHEVPNAAAAGR